MSSTVSDVARDKAARLLKKGGHTTASVTSSTSDPNARRPKKAGSVSTLSFADERSHDVSMRAPVRLENTYQLFPKQKFPIGQVQEVVKQILEEYLEHEQYKPELCRQMSKSLSEVVRARIKELIVPRYKIICLVYIGQLGNQCVRVGSRCLWDSAYDTFATSEFKNKSLFAICTVYAVYAE